MKQRTIPIHGGPAGRAVLAEAIRCFAEAAYPPGGSDCAQVSRETLYSSAAIIAEDPAPEVSRRHRVMLKQAAQWYSEHLAPIADEQRPVLADALTRLVRGDEVSDSEIPPLKEG